MNGVGRRGGGGEGRGRLASKLASELCPIAKKLHSLLLLQARCASPAIERQRGERAEERRCRNGDV